MMMKLITFLMVSFFIVQIKNSTFNTQHSTLNKMFKTIDFRALTAITLFLLALLFSLPNLVIAMLLMLLISALLELIRMLGQWQPART